MKKVEILAVSAHEEILKTILRLINANEDWNASGAGNEEEAVNLFKQKDFDLVLFGAGISDEEWLKGKLQSLHPDIICVDHYGGGSGLLKCEILQGLEKRNSIKN